jgi:hypothetical protein
MQHSVARARLHDILAIEEPAEGTTVKRFALTMTYLALAGYAALAGYVWSGVTKQNYCCRRVDSMAELSAKSRITMPLEISESLGKEERESIQRTDRYIRISIEIRVATIIFSLSVLIVWYLKNR